MSTKGRKEEDKEEVATDGPKGFAELCESMMAAKPGEGCGSRMREMMSHCMANSSDEQTDPK